MQAESQFGRKSGANSLVGQRALADLRVEPEVRVLDSSSICTPDGQKFIQYSFIGPEIPDHVQSSLPTHQKRKEQNVSACCDLSSEFRHSMLSVSVTNSFHGA